MSQRACGLVKPATRSCAHSVMLSQHVGAISCCSQNIVKKGGNARPRKFWTFRKKIGWEQKTIKFKLCVVCATCVMLTQHIDDNVDFFFSFSSFFLWVSRRNYNMDILLSLRHFFLYCSKEFMPICVTSPKDKQPDLCLLFQCMHAPYCACQIGMITVVSNTQVLKYKNTKIHKYTNTAGREYKKGLPSFLVISYIQYQNISLLSLANPFIVPGFELMVFI